MDETEPSPTIPNIASTDEFDVVVYPNPIQDRLKIRLFVKESDIFKISIFDAVGRLITTTEIDHANEQLIDFQNINSGIYLLKIEDSKGNIVTKKVVKQ